MIKKVSRTFYHGPTISVAKALLGKYLVHISAGVERIGMIVEVEAYLGPHDLASHSAKGCTARNQAMFGSPGRAYIYLIYGLHYCMNVVTEPSGYGAAVLLRALQPIKNINQRSHGPGLLCKAMDIDKRLNATDLNGDYFYIATASLKKNFDIIQTTRIGVHYAQQWANKMLRFYIKDNGYISKK